MFSQEIMMSSLIPVQYTINVYLPDEAIMLCCLCFSKLIKTIKQTRGILQWEKTMFVLEIKRHLDKEMLCWNEWDKTC